MGYNDLHRKVFDRVKNSENAYVVFVKSKRLRGVDGRTIGPKMRTI